MHTQTAIVSHSALSPVTAISVSFVNVTRITPGTISIRRPFVFSPIPSIAILSLIPLGGIDVNNNDDRLDQICKKAD